MNRTKIEWVKNPDGSQGMTWNPLTGCLNGCEYCYARKLAKGRLSSRYLANRNLPLLTMQLVQGDRVAMAISDSFYPRFWEDRLKDIERPPYPFSAWVGNAPMTKEWADRQPPNYHARRKKKGIFVCDMSDLFGIGIPEYWTRRVLEEISINGVDRFYLLTKQPQNLIKFSPFPDNCWVGVTATNHEMFNDAIGNLITIEAKVKYISFEPLLAPTEAGILDQYHDWPVMHGSILHNVIDWIIIGAQTKPYKPPEISWVQEIVEACDKAKIPVFLKNNLKPLLTSDSNGHDVIESHNLWAFKYFKLRQEMPIC